MRRAHQETPGGRVLTDEDLAFFGDYGYVVVRGAVPPALCRAAAEALWAFLEMDPDDPDDWYREPVKPGVTSVEMYHHQAFWDVRQHPRVYGAFADVLGEERLWVSIDRASFKPPRHPRHLEYDFHGFIHWDGDPATLLARRELRVQGVLCLTDTDEQMGGFQCVPGYHRRLRPWLRARARRRAMDGTQRWLARAAGRTTPPVDDPLHPDSLTRAPWLSHYPEAAVTRLSNAAGDLIVWDQRLPHGNGRNVSARPRLAQYVTMHQAKEHDAAARDARIRQWRERTGEGDPRGWERARCAPAALTDLGRRLLGLDRWGRVPQKNS